MGKRSAVWAYFKSTDGTGKQVICSLCKQTVRAGDSNTSNLWAHLRDHHPVQHTASKPKSATSSSSSRTLTVSTAASQSPIAAAFSRGQPYDKKGETWRRLTEAITYWIAKDSMPFAVVEKPGFLHLLRALDARYSPPSKSSISKIHIPKLYDVTRNRVMEELRDVKYFSATSDMWSSHGMTPYMGYTVHHISSDWVLKRHSLGTRYVPESHTAAVLSDAMTTLLEEWNLDPAMQTCITTDNGANILKATKDLTWTQLSCFGHNLHLGITKSWRGAAAENAVTRALRIAHRIVAAFNYSWNKRRDLAAEQVKAGQTPKSLASVSLILFLI